MCVLVCVCVHVCTKIAQVRCFILYLRVGEVLSTSHLTPASSLWTQLCAPRALAGQLARRVSVPTQRTLSSQIIPSPSPNRARMMAVFPAVRKKRHVNRASSEPEAFTLDTQFWKYLRYIMHISGLSALCICIPLPLPENPSCLHTTLAS